MGCDVMFENFGVTGLQNLAARESFCAKKSRFAFKIDVSGKQAMADSDRLIILRCKLTKISILHDPVHKWKKVSVKA